MKSLLELVASGALAVSIALPGTALASPVTFTDVTGPGLHQCLSAAAAACDGGGSYAASTTFTLDITDSGFVPNSVITSATLTLTIADDGGAADSSEKLNLFLDGVPFQSNANANHDVDVTFSDFTTLSDGKLVVVLTATERDFFFEGATLTVVYDPAAGGTQEGTTGSDQSPTGPAAVPAPAGLVTLGMGLVAVRWKRRAGR